MIRNPETITTRGDLDAVIAELEEFERLHGKPAGIVKRQNRSLGSSYDITTAEEANAKLGKWEDSETYLKFWPKQHFYDLADKYK